MSRRGSVLIVALAAVLPFLPVVGGEFVSDDIRFVRDNPSLSDPAILTKAFSDPTTVSGSLFGPDWQGIYRPLRTLDFALDRALGGGASWVFHVHGILWHLAASILVFLLLTRLIGSGGPALFGGVLFALHPAQVESVAWISSRGDVMAGALAAGTLLLALRDSRPARLAALGTFVLALLAKESAVVVPAFLALLLFRNRESSRRRSLVRVLPYVGLTVAYLVVRSLVLAGAGDDDWGHRREWWGGSWLGAWLTMARGAVHYAQILFVPTNLMHDFHVPQPDGLAPDATILLVLVLAGTALAVRAWWRGSLLGLGGLLLLAGLAPVSNVVATVNIPTASRFLYLPLVGFALAGSVLVGRLPGRARRWTVPLVLLLALVSLDRAIDWRDERSLWDVSLHDPESGHVLGTVTSVRAPATRAFLVYEEGEAVLAAGGDPGQAAARFDEARRLIRRADAAARRYAGYDEERRFVKAPYLEALLSLRLSQACGRDLLMDAVRHAEDAVAAGGERYAPASAIGGRVCAELGLLGQAAIAYRQAIAVAPGEPAHRRNLARVLVRLAQVRLREDRPWSAHRALDLLAQAIEQDPSPESNRDAYALRDALARDRERLLDRAKRAAAAAGTPETESIEIARVHARFGEFGRARDILERRSKREDADAAALGIEVAAILHRWRDTPEQLGLAIRTLEGLGRMRQLSPRGHLELARAAERLAELFLGAGRADEARKLSTLGLAAVVRSMSSPDFEGLALNGALLARRAAAERALGNGEAALRAYGKASQALARALGRDDAGAGPARIRATRLLAEALEALGERRVAASRLREVLASDPAPADARMLEIRIRTLEGPASR